jgi:hypothetical protein
MNVAVSSCVVDNVSSFPSTRKHGGLKIAGRVTLQGQNKQARVRLYEKLTGKLISEVATDREGEYEFLDLSLNTFMVISVDLKSLFNAVIQDNVVPK